MTDFNYHHTCRSYPAGQPSASQTAWHATDTVYLNRLPIAVLLIDWLVEYFASSYNLVLPFVFHWTHPVLSLLILLAIYFIGTVSGRRRIARMPLQEVIKAYQD